MKNKLNETKEEIIKVEIILKENPDGTLAAVTVVHTNLKGDRK